VTRSGQLRLLLLGAAVVCALIGVRFLPAVSTADNLSPRPAVIVNDLGDAVVVVHCDATCPAGRGTRLAPAQELRAGPAGARWRVDDALGAPVGCLRATSAGERLLVSRAVPCSP
jgi:hypothetical protein